jgi:DNA-binding MarR family transcriptional regulator
MSHAMEIINSLVNIAEHSAMLRHGGEVVLDGINLAEVHCIDQIGAMDGANVTKIADAMGMTRGAISKISKKLLAKELIESYQRPENNKEVYFRLTEPGRRVYADHRICHLKAQEKKLAILAGYSECEQVVILKFLTDIIRLHDDRKE